MTSKNYSLQTETAAGGPWHLGYTGSLDATESGNGPGWPLKQSYAWSDSNPLSPDGFSGTDLYPRILSVPDEDVQHLNYGVVGDEMMYHYYADNTVHYTWTGADSVTTAGMEARTEVKLFTGGKAVAGRNSLFCINAAATQYIAPGNISGINFPDDTWFNTQHAPVPNSKLKVGKKAVGADGNLWVAFPDNSEQTITVSAKGVHHYDAGVTVTKVIPDVQLAVDMNRNNNIDFGGSDATSATENSARETSD
jgi:hypothetical protein